MSGGVRVTRWNMLFCHTRIKCNCTSTTVGGSVFCTKNRRIVNKPSSKKIFNSEEKKGRDNETNEKRNYDEAYVELGFTVTTVRDEERPRCQKMFIV